MSCIDEVESNLQNQKGSMRSSQQLTTLLIDLDGTLLYSSPFILRWGFLIHFLWRSKFYHGIPFLRSLKALHWIKKSVENPDFARTSNKDLAIQIFARHVGLNHQTSESILSNVVSSCFKKMKWQFKPLPGSKDFVTWARSKGYRLVLATNPLWPKEIVKWRLELALLEWTDFSYHTTSESMKTCKPMVGYYQELIDHLNVEPAECLMIGNDDRKDSPASLLGIEVFLIVKQATQFGPKIHFGNFAEIQKFLESKS